MAKTRSSEPHGPEYEEFGKNLAAARNRLGMSQAELSERLNMLQSTYAGYETGTRKIPLSVIMQITSFLNVSFEELIGRKPTRQNDSFLVYDGEKSFLLKYRLLNNEGKKKLSERTDELLDLGYVQKGDEQKMA